LRQPALRHGHRAPRLSVALRTRQPRSRSVADPLPRLTSPRSAGTPPPTGGAWPCGARRGGTGHGAHSSPAEQVDATLLTPPRNDATVCTATSNCLITGHNAPSQADVGRECRPSLLARRPGRAQESPPQKSDESGPHRDHVNGYIDLFLPNWCTRVRLRSAIAGIDTMFLRTPP
jgi:hypothetical protein